MKKKVAMMSSWKCSLIFKNAIQSENVDDLKSNFSLELLGRPFRSCPHKFQGLRRCRVKNCISPRWYPIEYAIREHKHQDCLELMICNGAPLTRKIHCFQYCLNVNNFPAAVTILIGMTKMDYLHKMDVFINTYHQHIINLFFKNDVTGNRLKRFLSNFPDPPVHPIFNAILKFAQSPPFTPDKHFQVWVNHYVNYPNNSVHHTFIRAILPGPPSWGYPEGGTLGLSNDVVQFLLSFLPSPHVFLITDKE